MFYLSNDDFRKDSNIPAFSLYEQIWAKFSLFAKNLQKSSCDSAEYQACRVRKSCIHLKYA